MTTTLMKELDRILQQLKTKSSSLVALRSRDYDAMLNRVTTLIDEAHRASARTVNALLTAA